MQYAVPKLHLVCRLKGLHRSISVTNTIRSTYHIPKFYFIVFPLFPVFLLHRSRNKKKCRIPGLQFFFYSSLLSLQQPVPTQHNTTQHTCIFHIPHYYALISPLSLWRPRCAVLTKLAHHLICIFMRTSKPLYLFISIALKYIRSGNIYMGRRRTHSLI